MAKCNSCGAAIVWFKTPGGKAIPLDPVAHQDGNIVLDGDLATVLSRESLEMAQVAGTVLYKSHFATCPQASEHRRRGA